jgi:hypothetical protein
VLNLFGCSHRDTTFPQTPVNRLRRPTGEPTVVCLDCGKRFAYDAINFKRGREIRESQPAMDAAEREA